MRVAGGPQSDCECETVAVVPTEEADDLDLYTSVGAWSLELIVGP